MYNLDRYFDFDSPPKSEIKPKPQKTKQENLQYLVLILLAGTGYYLYFYLSKKREEAKAEINKLLTVNSLTATDLDANCWKNRENWAEYVDSLYFASQINLFVREMKEEIRKKILPKKEDLEKIREKAVKEIEELAKQNWTDDEWNSLELQKKLEQFTKKINKTSANKISSVVDEANKFIIQIKVRRQGLHWKTEPHNWADRWLVRNRTSFESAWEKMNKMFEGEPKYFDISAIYKIHFPPSLWNELTEKEKQLSTKKGHGELKLRNEVKDYKFNELITQWEEKARPNPVRGELDPNDLTNLDNNAIFYGVPRTGKSVMAEKLAYEADIYPLVVIKGSTLTPKKSDSDIGATLLLKFIFTIADITHKLVEDFNYERAKDGEVRYILFIDEADQACTTQSLPPKDASSGLFFLKECMGDDNKDEETKNLWIAATNHLNNIDLAIYQSGRLSNRLCFSWTLGDFIKYAKDAGIYSQFPDRWLENTVLNDEDNQWVEKFNKIIFDREFLPYWNKFITNNPNAEYEPEKTEEPNENDEEKKDKKIKIKWGEMFEFFWQLKNSNQLEHFEGKFTNPRSPKIEEVIKESAILSANQISKSIDIRLKGVDETATKIEEEMKLANDKFDKSLRKYVEEITGLLTEIGRKINN